MVFSGDMYSYRYLPENNNCSSLIKIEYPPYTPSIKTVEGTEFIFDTFRKKWLVLTPEEWVRQNFISYLVKVLNYPKSLIAIEKEIKVGAVTKRFDIVVYNRSTLPFMVVECKEMNVSLSEKVLHQVLHYNTNMQAEYVVITNGSYCYGYRRVGDGFVEVGGLPEFNEGLNV